MRSPQQGAIASEGDIEALRQRRRVAEKNCEEEIILKLKFYKHTVQILELGLKENADIFEDLPLSIILNPHRDLIFKSI